MVVGRTKCFVEHRKELIVRNLGLDPSPTQYKFFSADAYRRQGSRDMVLIVSVMRFSTGKPAFSKPSLLDSFGDLDCGPRQCLNLSNERKFSQMKSYESINVPIKNDEYSKITWSNKRRLPRTFFVDFRLCRSVVTCFCRDILAWSSTQRFENHEPVFIEHYMLQFEPRSDLQIADFGVWRIFFLCCIQLVVLLLFLQSYLNGH